MNNGIRTKFGLTLVEILVVVAVIAILAAMVIGISTRIDNQAKEKLTNSTIAILSAALEQFHDYGYNYPPIYSEFDFPLDCNGFTVDGLKTTFAAALQVAPIDIGITYHDETLNPKYLEYSGCEVMYFFLSRVPECRQILDKIDGSLVTNINDEKQEIEISIDSQTEPLLRVVDPWGTTLRYDYYDETQLDPVLRANGKRTFPVIISAGPDKEFWTLDDISNR